ncbi:MAG: hypothetical protein ACAI44_10770 [Candidatus Sericytochromatia bacterium]
MKGEKMRVETWVTWFPAREANLENKEFKQRMYHERFFLVRPASGEQVRIEGEFFQVTHFFHDTDAQRLQICLQPELRHTEAEAQVRVSELEQKGWKKA